MSLERKEALLALGQKRSEEAYTPGAIATNRFLARKYVAAHWAFLATLGIWGASSLPVYMYFNPAWSHVQSAFAVAFFPRY